METLLLLGAAAESITATGWGILAVLITSLTTVAIALIQMWSKRAAKRAAKDPDTKRRLAEAEKIKADSLRKELIADIRAEIAPLIDDAIKKAQSGVSGIQLNLSERIAPIEKGLDGIKDLLTEILKLQQDLWKWHNVDDPLNPGRKAWYSPNAEINDLVTVIISLKDLSGQNIKQVAQLERALALFIAASTGKAPQ